MANEAHSYLVSCKFAETNIIRSIIYGQGYEKQCLSDVILEKKGEPHNYLVNFKLAVANIIANIVYGQR